MIPAKQPLLSIILPFYNEEKNIVPLLDEYKKFSPRYHFELLCVNNGSTDGTEKVLNTYKKKKKYSFIKLVTVKKNIGYGHGIMTGVKKTKGEIIAWTHADMQTPAADVFKAYNLYRKHPSKIHLVKGKRTGRHFLDTAVSMTMALFATMVLRMPFYEINAQPKLFHRSFVPYLRQAPDDFLLDLYCLYLAKKHHYLISSFTVSFRKRKHGKSKWAYSWRSRLWMIKRTITYILSLSRASGDQR